MSTDHTFHNKARILFDGHCQLCRRSVGMLRRLDWFSRLTYVDVRDEQLLKRENISIELDRLVEEMHLITPQGERTYHGFGAFRWFAWRLPLLWIVAPFLYIPGVPTLGQKLYLWIARNRFRLVPCHGGVCTLPPKEETAVKKQV